MPFDIDFSFPLEAEAMALAIDIPLEAWPLNCHAIACAVRDLLPVDGMRLVRGSLQWPGRLSLGLQRR